MDPLTHTATGIFLSRAGLNRWTPLALPVLVLAANAPDIDIVTLAGGPLNYLHYHRHLTHSLAAMPVMAILVVAFVRLAARRPVRWAGAFLAALLAVASHLLLDYTNEYGIRLLLPFSNSWQRLDLTSVVDLWIWTAILLAFAGPFLARLVTSEIRSGKPGGRHGRSFAWAALLFLLAYNGGRSVLHARAVATLDTRLYGGAEPLRVAALPSQNPLDWRGLVETGDFYAVEDVNLAGQFDPNTAHIFYKPEASPAMDTARATHTFRIFLGFSQFPLWRVTAVSDPPNGKQVDVFDLRFGTPSQPAFRASALVNASGKVVAADFQFRGQRASPKN
ncbi:MAG TPA: metal-dependent hydrolase [Bryobacteraceae bacterium]|nr:metal-dependent hydrolase [Bryobacteraceae bacterium]